MGTGEALRFIDAEDDNEILGDAGVIAVRNGFHVDLLDWNGRLREAWRKPENLWRYRRMGPCWLQRILTVLDEFTRECLAIHVARSIRSADLIQVLEWLFLTRGVPEHIRSDNGPEFVAEATRRWLGRQEVATIFITPGSPWENPFIESFNGTLRDHCLNMYAFVSIRDANAIVEDWRWEYSHHRPHSSLSGMPPAAFAASAATPLRPTASAPLQRREKTVATLSN